MEFLIKFEEILSNAVNTVIAIRVGLEWGTIDIGIMGILGIFSILPGMDRKDF